MPRWLDSYRRLGIWGLVVTLGVGLGAAGVRAGPPLGGRTSVASPTGTVRSAASNSVAAKSPAAPTTQPIQGDFEDTYQARLAEIKSKDPEGLFQLALLCSTNNRPDLAANLCRQVLASWSAHARAKALLRASNQRLAVTSRSGTASRPASGQPTTSQPGLTIAGVLGPEAINRVRFREFRFEDMTDRPRVTLSRQVIQEFLEEAAKSQAMSDLDKNLFNRADNDDKLRWIIKVAGDRYLGRIQMTSEPRSMATFRQKIWPILGKGCAVPACHGGEKAGSLRYVLPVSYGPAMATNFYIVGQFETGQGKLINREHPEASLLLQYGLSGEQAEFKHPVAIPPVFTSISDGKYQIVLEWIRQRQSPTPNYGITDRMWQNLPGRPTVPPPAGPEQPGVGARDQGPTDNKNSGPTADKTKAGS